VSRGRIYFVTSDAVYAIGASEARPLEGWAVDEPAVSGEGAPAHLQVVPTELVLEPGSSVALRARLFDAQGRFLGETPAEWTLEGLTGEVEDGTFTAAGAPRFEAGVVRAAAE